MRVARAYKTLRVVFLANAELTSRFYSREQSSKFTFSREQNAELVFSRAGKAYCSRFLAQVKIFWSSLWSGWSIEEMVRKECTGRCAPFRKNCEIATLCVLFRLKPAITTFFSIINRISVLLYSFHLNDPMLTVFFFLFVPLQESEHRAGTEM